MSRYLASSWSSLFFVAACVASWVAPASASVESEVQAALAGRYGITRAPLSSECTDHFTNLKVVGSQITGAPSGSTRFESGEMIYIDKVSIGTFAGLDVNVSIVEPYLLSWEDGPFTAYERRRCRAQLHFEVGRDVRRDRAKSIAAVEAVLELATGGEAQARELAGWNRRRVAPFPKDWERTQVEYAKYRMAKRNEEVRKKTEEVLEQADQALRYMDSDAEYLLSFAEGAKARSDSWSDCDAMLGASFSASGSSAKDYEGWADGQKVAWATHLAEELQDCYVEPQR